MLKVRQRPKYQCLARSAKQLTVRLLKVCLLIVSYVFCGNLLAKTTTPMVSIQASQQSPLQSLLPMLGGLAFILLLIFVLAFFLKKLGRFKFNQSLIKVVQSQNIGGKSRLLVVEIEGDQFLLGVTPQNISKITRLSQRAEGKSVISANKSGFESVLNGFLQPSFTTLPPETTSADKANKNKSKHASEGIAP